jgi:hypothetical protein
MEFPRYVFTSPGPEKHGADTVGTKLVIDDDEYNAAIDAGFYDTSFEAIDAAKNPKVEEPKPEEIVKDKPADSNLSAKAEKLGIKIDKRWSAGRLAEEITKAEEA